MEDGRPIDLLESSDGVGGVDGVGVELYSLVL